MEQGKSKFALTSKTIIGALMVMAAPFLSKFLGGQVDEALQADITNTISDLLVNGGALLAIYGRLKASSKLKL